MSAIVTYSVQLSLTDYATNMMNAMSKTWVVNSASCLMVSHVRKRIFGASLTRLSASGHFFLASASFVVASITCLPKLSWSLAPVKTYFVTNFGRRSNKRCLGSARRRQLLCWSRSEMRRVRLRKTRRPTVCRKQRRRAHGSCSLNKTFARASETASYVLIWSMIYCTTVKMDVYTAWPWS